MTSHFDRIQPTLLALAAAVLLGGAATAQAAGPDAHVIVAFKPGASAAARQAIANAGGRVTVDLSEVDSLAVTLPQAAVAALARNPNVEYVEQDALRRALAATSPSGPPYESGQLVPFGIPMVQADQLSDSMAGNRTLCIVDSGYEAAHEDLTGNNVHGENLTRSGQWYTDELHHGTHVGGTISAVDQANIGVVGVLPHKHINLYIAKVFDAGGTARTSVISRAAQNCLKNGGANLISMSLGGGAYSRTEQRVYDKIAAQNVLVIAAAGNAGDTTISYPAGYASVMSVAAVDENKAWASFSQYNSTVEISGPGVEVLSTVPMGTGRDVSLTVGGTPYAAIEMEGSPLGSATGPLADFGTGEAVDAGMAGKICLIQRGNISFAQKVLNCQASGGLGAVIYNNTAGPLFGTLSGTATTIPSAGVSDTAGAAMLGQIGQSTTLSITATNYAFFQGTSMATPHVSGVAALVWSLHTNCTAAQIRSTLTKSAMDIGDAGRDDKTGWGLVQAKAASDRIDTEGCGN